MSLAVILTFTSIEFMDYRRVETETSILVDRSMGQKLTIRFNMTFPKVPCYRNFSITRLLSDLTHSSPQSGYHGHQRRAAERHLAQCSKDSP